MTVFDWTQVALDVLAFAALGFHKHSIHWYNARTGRRVR